ncbi:MAG: 8-oxo-dGTP diphosphatase MutT [Mogibacterium sp.]|nr:8-oxo-dGTP diphosphatase MutT [Mogibacterium sp.]
MKRINVVAAIICNNGRIFATQRGYGNYQHKWEFPGGKIEPGETPEEALVREIREELEAEIEVGELFDTVEYDYPEFHVSMRCYLCSLVSDNLTLVEHEAAKWLDRDNIDSVDWLPSDLEIIARLKAQKGDITGPVHV